MNQNLNRLKKLLAHPQLAPWWKWIDSWKLKNHLRVLDMLLLGLFITVVLSGPALLTHLDIGVGILLFAEFIFLVINPHSSLNLWTGNRTIANVLLLTIAAMFYFGTATLFTAILYSVPIFIFMRRSLQCGFFFVRNNKDAFERPLSDFIDTKVV